jgi:hypothetical protein
LHITESQYKTQKIYLCLHKFRKDNIKHNWIITKYLLILEPKN